MNNLWSTFLRTVIFITCQILSRRIWKWISAINEYWDLLILWSNWSCRCWLLRLKHVTNIREYHLDTNDHLFIVTIIIIIYHASSCRVSTNWPFVTDLMPLSDTEQRVCWARPGVVRQHSKGSRQSHPNQMVTVEFHCLYEFFRLNLLYKIKTI